MKCCYCGQLYESPDGKCPYCGTETYSTKSYNNKLARLLAKRLPCSSLNITFLSVIMIIMVNISLIAIIANFITFVAAGNGIVWAHYVISALLTVYILLKSSFVSVEKIPAYVRAVVYIVIFTFTVSQLFGAYDKWWSTGFVTPIAITLLNLYILISYMTHKAKTSTFLSTMITNVSLGAYSVIMTVIVNLIEANATKNGTSFDMFWGAYNSSPMTLLGSVFVYVSFGISAFILLNFALIKTISATSKIKRLK